MQKYIYINKSVRPDAGILANIHTDVAASSMTNKNIQYCNWEEEVDEVWVYFDIALSAEDKTALDVIVANNT